MTEPLNPLSPHTNVNQRITLRLRIYFVISLILVAIVIYHIIHDQIGLLFPLIAIIVGTVIGTALSRMNKITWDHGAQEVISKFDALGVAILIVYIVFAINRQRIIETFVHGPDVVGFTLALVAGIMFGRIIGINRKVAQVLEKQNLS